MNNRDFEDWVEVMRNFGDQLVPYSTPFTDAAMDEVLNLAKVKMMQVDGYVVVLVYSKNDHDDHFIESVQIAGKEMPFLPFHLVLKIGKKFLGASNLALVEYPRDGCKIYCWICCTDKHGRPVPYPYSNGEPCQYEGVVYNYLDPSQVQMY